MLFIDFYFYAKKVPRVPQPASPLKLYINTRNFTRRMRKNLTNDYIILSFIFQRSAKKGTKKEIKRS